MNRYTIFVCSHNCWYIAADIQYSIHQVERCIAEQKCGVNLGITIIISLTHAPPNSDQCWTDTLYCKILNGRVNIICI